MAHAYYVTSFRHLTCSEPIDEPVELLPGVLLTTGQRHRQQLLTPEFKKVAGKIEAEYLRKAPNFVFGEFEEEHLKGLNGDQFLVMVILWIDSLFTNLWLLHDHNLECDAIFLSKRIENVGASWTRNFLARRPTQADGHVAKSLSLSKADLKGWASQHDTIESYRFAKSSGSHRFPLARGYARTGRAIEFVSAARCSENLAVKIANYCSALETLLSTDAAELSHKLAERAAMLLSTKGFDRWNVFTTIKRAYAVRSKTVHGATLNTAQIEDLGNLSVECDRVVRSCLTLILADPGLCNGVFDADSSTAVEDYFNELLLGKPTPQKT